MLLGAILMLVGCLLVIRNREVAIFLHAEHRRSFTELSSSAARQNIAIIGVLVFGAGIGAFALL